MEEVSSFRRCTDKEIIRLLSVFQGQFQASSNWHMEKIDIREIIPLCKHVYSERLNFARKGILNCIQYGIPLFYPYVIKYDNGNSHLVAPPIVEERNQSLFLGDGMHRIYSLLELNILTASVLVTHDCTLPLPGIPQTWGNVKENDIQLPCEMNFENFFKQGLTGYSKFCNSNLFWKYREA